jgi:putative acyl-CoA dehydrogenase
MKLSSESGAHSSPWTDKRMGGHVARTAGGITGGQVEAGHGCPITMTFAAIPALRATPEVLAEWEAP